MNDYMARNSAGCQDPFRTFVYIAGSDDRRIIKIGRTQLPGARLTTLRAQALNSFGCATMNFVAVWPENGEEEEQLHERFSAFSLGHEFYLWHPEIINYAISQEFRFAPRSMWHTRSKRCAHEDMGWPTDRPWLAKSATHV